MYRNLTKFILDIIFDTFLLKKRKRKKKLKKLNTRSDPIKMIHFAPVDCLKSKFPYSLLIDFSFI